MSLLRGQVGIVTGASRGIGRAIAHVLASQGASIGVMGRDNQTLQATLSQLQPAPAAGPAHCVQVCDMGVPHAIEPAVAKISEYYGGKLDFLVNAAGITGKQGPLVRLNDDVVNEVLQTNLAAAITLSRAVYKPMLAAASSRSSSSSSSSSDGPNDMNSILLANRVVGGNIIHISSIVGQRGNKGQAIYAASKAGLQGLCTSLAQELGPRNIRVNAISPGFINTDMTAGLDNNSITQRTALGRIGTVEDVAQAVLALFMCQYVTGQTLCVDGGLRM